MFARSKGQIVHIGFGVLLLILIVGFLFLYFTSPSTANGVLNGLHSLASAIGAVKP